MVKSNNILPYMGNIYAFSSISYKRIKQDSNFSYKVVGNMIAETEA